jgi:hypothetical protein
MEEATTGLGFFLRELLYADTLGTVASLPDLGGVQLVLL